jgi:hypothetical protein
MIPDKYWRILRIWFWLIGAIALAGGALAVVLVPQVRGSGEPDYTAAVTLGVTRLVSTDGSVTTIAGSGEGELLAGYTSSIIARGNSPQFVSEVVDRLQAQGLTIDQATLARKLTFAEDPGLFRILITARASDADKATLMAQSAALQMIDDITGEEQRVTEEARASLALQEQNLRNRLSTLYANRALALAALGDAEISQALRDLVASGVSPDLSADYRILVNNLARLTSDPELTLMNAQALSLEQQLSDITTKQNAFSADSLTGTPVSIIDPVNAAPLPVPEGMRTRDMALMGVIGGLVLGWFVAVALDSIVFAEKRKTAKRRRPAFAPAKVRETDGRA